MQGNGVMAEPFPTTIRRAILGDSDGIAHLFRSVRKTCLPFLPDLHTPEQELWVFRERVFPTSHVWVAEGEGIVGFGAYRAGWVDHLYVRPDFQGQGLGSALLTKAMEAQPHLKLWVFQKNAAAIRFYVAMGFACVEETDGSRNEEREPDAIYEWRSSVTGRHIE